MHHVRRGNRHPSSQQRRNSLNSANTQRRPFTQHTTNSSSPNPHTHSRKKINDTQLNPLNTDDNEDSNQEGKDDEDDELRVLTLDEIKERARRRKEREAALAANSSESPSTVPLKGKPALYPESSSKEGESPVILEELTSSTPARESLGSDTVPCQRRVRIDRRRVEPANAASSINSEPLPEIPTASLQSGTARKQDLSLRLQARPSPDCEDENSEANTDNNCQDSNGDVEMAEAPSLLEQRRHDEIVNPSSGIVIKGCATKFEIFSSQQLEPVTQKSRPGRMDQMRSRSSNKDADQLCNSENPNTDANDERLVNTTEVRVTSQKLPANKEADRACTQRNQSRTSPRPSQNMARGRSPTQRDLKEETSFENLRNNSNSPQNRQRILPPANDSEIRQSMAPSERLDDFTTARSSSREYPANPLGSHPYPSGQECPEKDRSSMPNSDEANTTSEKKHITGKRNRSEINEVDFKARLLTGSPRDDHRDYKNERRDDRNNSMATEREDRHRRDIQSSTRHGQHSDNDRSVDDRNFEAYEHERALIARRKKMRLNSDASSIGRPGNDSTWKARLGTSRPNGSEPEQATGDSRTRSHRPRYAESSRPEEKTEAMSVDVTNSSGSLPNQRENASYEQDEETGWGRPIPRPVDPWEKSNANSTVGWNGKDEIDSGSSSVFRNKPVKPTRDFRKLPVTKATMRVESDPRRNRRPDASYEKGQETGWGRPPAKRIDPWEESNANSAMDWSANDGNDSASASLHRDRRRQSSPGYRPSPVTKPTVPVETNKRRHGTTGANYGNDEESGWGRPPPKQVDPWENSDANTAMDWNAKNANESASTSEFRNRPIESSPGYRQSPVTRTTRRNESRNKDCDGPIHDRSTLEKDTLASYTGNHRGSSPTRSAKKGALSGQETRSRIREADTQTPSRTRRFSPAPMSTPVSVANSTAVSEAYDDRRTRKNDDHRPIRGNGIDSDRTRNQQASKDRRTSHAGQSLDRNSQERFRGGYESSSMRRPSMPPPMDATPHPSSSVCDRLGKKPDREHRYTDSEERWDVFSRRNRSDVISEGPNNGHQRRIGEYYHDGIRDGRRDGTAGFGKERAKDDERGFVNNRVQERSGSNVEPRAHRSGGSPVRDLSIRRGPYPKQQHEQSAALPPQSELLMERGQGGRDYDRRRPALPPSNRWNQHDQQLSQQTARRRSPQRTNLSIPPYQREVGEVPVGIPERPSHSGRGFVDRRRSSFSLGRRRDDFRDRPYSPSAPNNGDLRQERGKEWGDRQRGDSRNEKGNVRSTSLVTGAAKRRGTSASERSRSDVRRESFPANSRSARSRSPVVNRSDRQRSRTVSRGPQSVFSGSRTCTDDARDSSYYRSPASSRFPSRSESCSGTRMRTTTRSGEAGCSAGSESRVGSAGPISERGWNDEDIPMREVDMLRVEDDDAAPEDKRSAYRNEGTRSADERDHGDNKITTDVSEHREFFERKLRELRDGSNESERECADSNRMTFSELVHLIELVPSAVKVLDRYARTVYDAEGVIADLAGWTARAEEILDSGRHVDVGLDVTGRLIGKGKLESGDVDSASEVLTNADCVKEGKDSRKLRLFKKEVARHVVTALKPSYFENRMGTKDQFKNVSKAFTDQLMDLYTFSDEPTDYRSEGEDSLLPVVSSEALPEVVRKFVNERLSVVEMMNKKPFDEIQKEGEDARARSWSSGRQSGETGSAISSIDFSADAYRGNQGEKGRVVR